MKLSLAEIITLGIIIIMVITSIKDGMVSRSISYISSAIISSIASVISFFTIFKFYDYIEGKVEKFLLSISLDRTLNFLIKALIIIIIFFIIKWIATLVLNIINSIIEIDFDSTISRNKGLLFIVSSILGFIRGLLVVICIFIAIITYNGFVAPRYQINTFSNLKAYNKLDNLIDKKKISDIKSAVALDMSKSKIIYYNGVTIDEGIRSNSEINSKAKEIVKNDKTDKEKAKSLYVWVGSNIKYDFKKAEEVLSNKKVNNSGAIPAFEERKGICFDYACLYAAMCRAVNLKVRIVMGEAYNGEEYINHAWNEVYLDSEKRWIKVDPTFYIAGNYFDNKNFDKDHREKSIAGEW
ncbi:transglutaminase family protein [Clostridium baratii]|uniref:Transglutaminase-like superfamily protein n=4 Tax=Clostridium baratii TaxID=1561 RepID=A0A0A7FX81_9CLOT|nr:transglutaminase-like domain-containing protein [Clostridium baratii]AIY83431.1 transglutaminase-like superfamily protein [Clostridium baratii str. Sullivan]MDU1053715.1 transglutaminase-like domain-containing protein [Clostridium baratii]MDU4910615.1 transglutaminase-like domain-containing protein [Clostridium baratii]CUO96209.1 transglutaminase [Clostridium baratii]